MDNARLNFPFTNHHHDQESRDEVGKETTTDDITFPNVPDDENDDFSWLFKVLPPGGSQSDQIVPTGTSPLYGEATPHQISSMTPGVAPHTAMMADFTLSEMDLSSVGLHDKGHSSTENSMTFYKASVVEEEEEEEEKNGENKDILNPEPKKTTVRRSSRVTRPPPRLLMTLITDTPVSLRRAQRKRSYQQMIADDDLTSQDTKANGTVELSKRQKMQHKPKYETTPKNTAAVGENWTASTVTGKELKIVFRRHKPVNPIENALLSNRRLQRGLIDSAKTLVAEQYFKHCITPKAVPVLKKGVPSIMVENPLNLKKIEVLLKKEWIETSNTIANAKAHGKEALRGKKLTPDGNAIQGTFVTVDYDQNYDDLLKTQNSSARVTKLKEQFANKGKRNKQQQPTVNLDKTFSNFSNFENYFQNDDGCFDDVSSNHGDVSSDEDDDNKEATRRNKQAKLKAEGMTGAVSVDTRALKNTNSTLIDSWACFEFKGQLFRPNPAVVTIQRVPDRLIENMKAKREKITLESVFYNAMTSYFDNRLPPA